ncbi:MAG: choice-of-anchor B family protein [Saprospiraceae bacterium]|nr:choice-of-anchor B family protein [Saprospiraceae bacterium]MBK7912152.1 choice-of-anchor B family protein [Saprospiraceae bacterium]
MKNILGLLFFLVLSNSLVAQDGDLNMKIIAHVPAPSGGSGIWHYVDRNGIEYAAIGTRDALEIYSLEDPSKPILRASVKGVNTIWREVYAYQDYIYAVTDNASDGVIIVNMKNAPGTITSKFWTTSITANNQTANITTCHTVYVDDKGILCLNGCRPWQGVLFFDLNQDPDNPKFLGAETTRYCHDMFMRRDTLYSSEIYEGLMTAYDVRDKSKPVEINGVKTPFAFTHNNWPSDDNRYMFTTDEKENAYVAAYDISDIHNIKLLDQWRPKDTEGTGVIPHNTRYLDGYLITSYYTDGVKIIDAHRPENLIEVGSVDTYSGNLTGFHGCWGVSPFLPSKTIVASDIEGGLFVIKPQYIRACYLEGIVRDSFTDEVISNVVVRLITPRKNNEQTNLKGEYKTGYANAGNYMVEFSHPDYNLLTTSAVLENGVVTIKNVKLVPKNTIVQKIIVKEKGSLNLIADAKIVLFNANKTILAQTAADGVANIKIFQDSLNFQLVVGKWGYLHHAEVFSSLSPKAEIEVLLDKGYQDDFILEQNWTTKTTASTGAWVRGEPVGTISGIDQAQAESDVDTDLGDACYVTGNGTIDPSAADVDNGATILTSPTMDLSKYNEPLLNYSYWFYNGGGNNAPNDKIKFYILSGTDTLSIEDINRSESAWIAKERFAIKSLTNKLADVKFMVSIADDNPGHLVEGGLDAFLVFDGNPVANSDVNTGLQITLSATVFENQTILINPNAQTLNLSISNLKGQILLSTKIKHESHIPIGSTLEKGIYFVRVQNESGETKLFKVVKI